MADTTGARTDRLQQELARSTEERELWLIDMRRAREAEEVGSDSSEQVIACVNVPWRVWNAQRELAYGARSCVLLCACPACLPFRVLVCDP